MDKFYHSVRLDPAFYKGCINCIKRCPTQAIRIRNGKAQINGKFCIDCGKCIRVCPHHAKHVTYDKLDAVKQYEYTVALSAPSLYGQFSSLNNVSTVLNGLLLMGFDGMFEVGATAEIVSEVTESYLTEHGDWLPVTSTACPPVVRPIRVRFLNPIPHLPPLNPPAEVATCTAVERAMKRTGLTREKTGIIFISPCPSKATYVESSLSTEKSEVDHVLTIKGVYPQLLLYMRVVGEDRPEIGTSGKIRVSWGRSDGEASGLFMENYLAADGIENVIRVLEDLEDQKLLSLKFVELNARNGDCVGGMLMVENPYVTEVKLRHPRKYMLVARSHMEADAVDRVLWIAGVRFKPVFRLGDNMTESFSRLERVERLHKKFPGLDCGPCGAPICKVLAKDIVRGEASEKDCAYFSRGNLHSLSQEVAILVGNLADGDKGGMETLNVLKEYIQRISNKMTVLDSKMREK